MSDDSGKFHLAQSDSRRAAPRPRSQTPDGLHPGPNPFANLRLEQSRGRKDLIALTVAELDELAETALRVHGDFGPAFRAMILFSAYVGLRRGSG